MVISKANEKQLSSWDDFIDSSVNGTIFNKRRFLSYHKTKFVEGEEYLVVLNGNEVYAQISIHVTTDETGRKHARSPYGASYGGFIFKSNPTYKIGKSIITAFIEYLKNSDIKSLSITQPGNFFCESPLDTFIFNLMEAGFVSISRDILNVFEIEPSRSIIEQIVSSSARTQIRQAQKKGILIKNRAPVEDAYPLIEATINKFGKTPTHSFEEMKWLSANFSRDIYFVVAYFENIPIASVTNFAINKRVNSSFYISSDPAYMKLNAVRYVISSAIQCAQDDGYKYYDFGTSTSSLVGSEPVFAIKEEFSRTGLFRESLRWSDSCE